MTRRFQAFDARSRRPVDDEDAFDERGVIRDGYGMHVPLFMQDALQKAVRADARHRMKTVHRDPFGRELGSFETEVERDDEDEHDRRDDAALNDAALAMHRPGYRTSDAVDDDEAVKAYREYCDAQCNAWKKRDAQPPGSYPLSAGEGSACTINGAPGTLVREGDSLVCRPTRRTDAAPTSPVFDAAEGQRIKDEAWRAMCEEQSNAWRKKR